MSKRIDWDRFKEAARYTYTVEDKTLIIRNGLGELKVELPYPGFNHAQIEVEGERITAMMTRRAGNPEFALGRADLNMTESPKDWQTSY